MFKKHKSRDQDELFVKISASQQLLEHIAAQEDNFKVKICTIVYLFSVFCFLCQLSVDLSACFLLISG